MECFKVHLALVSYAAEQQSIDIAIECSVSNQFDEWYKD